MSSPAGDRVAIPRDAITLRPGTDGDYDFQRLLYHEGRAEEMQHFPFDEAQKKAFLDWQFDCQWKHYHEHYPTCEWNLVVIGERPVGRLLIDRWPDQIRIVDIALLSEFRGRGLGASLMSEILEEGQRSGKTVTIHVETFNPAMRLYERLGFRAEATSGAYIFMKWSPA